MLNKINVLPIIKDHLNTLRDNRTQKVSITDLFMFFAVPAVAAAALVWRDFSVDSDVRNVIGLSMAVFVGLLFNVLLVIYDVVSRRDTQDLASVRRREFLKEVYANLAFSILIAVGSLLLLVATAFTSTLATRVLSGIIFYLAGMFVLTLLMVLKRLHGLFTDQFSRPSTGS